MSLSAKTLREHREARRWTQAELAYRVGVAPSTIYNWERGRFKPRASQLRRLAEVLDVRMDEITFVHRSADEDLEGKDAA